MASDTLIANDRNTLPDCEPTAVSAITPPATPLVRLDRPASPCELLADVLFLKGWVFGPVGMFDRGAAANLSVLFQNLSARASMAYAGVEFSGHSLSETVVEGVCLKKLQIAKAGAEIPEDTARTGFLRYDFVAEVDLAEFRRTHATRQYCSLQLQVSFADFGATSNQVLFWANPAFENNKIFAELSFPRTSFICADFLLIEGWAFKIGDELKEAVVVLGGREVCNLRTELPNAKLNLRYPAVNEAEAAGFAGLVRHGDLAHWNVPRDKASGLMSFAVRCRFKSGAEVQLGGGHLQWQSEQETLARQGELFGEVETVRAVDGGLIGVEGWLVDKGRRGVKLVLEGQAGSRVFSADRAASGELDVGALERFERPDIEQSYALLLSHGQAGFSLKFHPAVLGKIPGRVQLIAEALDDSERVYLGPEECNRNIQTRMERSLSGDKAIVRAALHTANSLMGKRFRRVRALPSVFPSASYEKRNFPSRILFATPNLRAVEGAPRVLLSIIKHLSRLHPETKLLVVSSQGGELAEYMTDLDAKIGAEIIIDGGLSLRERKWDELQHALQRIQPRIREFKPDFIFANVIDSFWAADLAFRENLPGLWLIHESIEPLTAFSDADPRLRLMALNRLRASCKPVFVSKRTAELFKNYIGAYEPLVVPNGIDISPIEAAKSSISKEAARKELGIAENAAVVSIIGTTTPRKGQDIFLKEMARLKEKYPKRDFKFLVVGAREIEFLSELRSLASELNLSASLSFIYETPDVSRFYIASDILVIASREESAPLVSLEALAYGRPLVSTSVFGLAEQLTDNENALIFDYQNAGELAEKVGLLLDNKALQEKLVANGQKSIREKFALEPMLARYVELIREAYQGK